MIAPTVHPRLRGTLGVLALLVLPFGAPGRASTVATAPAARAPGAAPADALAHPSAGTPASLVLLSTTDVLGKSSPCGCHTPKGGLARRAAFADSVRAVSPNLLVLDSGGFFPEEADYESAAAFMLDAMKSLGVDAAGLGESDLRFGRAFLLAGLARTKLPVTCANLFDRASGAPLVAPYLIRQAGRAKVGVFGLLTDKGDLGPSRDSLRVTDPLAAAERTVATLRAKGATVIVCLAELGKVESEEVANVVDGIDLVVAGRKMPLFANGRRFRNTLVVYGGDQSHFIGRTLLTLDGAGRAVTGEAATFMLGPEVPEQPAMLVAVKRFEDGFNEELKAREKARALQAVGGEGGEADDEPRDHYVGAEVCGRCHRPEFEQWKTTAHARAWATLVEAKSEARPDCVKCHVVGYGKPGGFNREDDAPRLVNVQCEMCHGMGTQHDASRTAAKLTEATCRQCHDDTSSPAFSFAIYQPHIVHRPPSVLPPLPPRPATAMHQAAPRP
jgi:hypothetical protein